ncbi:MAG TPA: pyridoxamine 5'-phosphate oxidase family protein [Vicinamibacteria bacterium]|nr:pyridoxamine 5'-phosphate oxidase family protein [Vicinamibacteria bacterium]
MAKAKKGNGGQDRPKDPAKRLRKLIKGARVVMLTTVAPDGRFRSRPMLPGAFEDGSMWFLTRVPSAKTADIADNQRVNLAYSSPKNDRYVSISGAATILHDAARVKDLWEGEHKAWFAGGKNDPELAVLRVQVDQVEFWDGDSGRMVPLTGPFAEGAAPAPAAKGPAPVSPGALG